MADDREHRHGPPREVCPGFHWLFQCDVTAANGNVTHGYNAAFLLVGSERTIMVDTSIPKHWPTIERQLDQALAGRRLDYVLPTHSITTLAPTHGTIIRGRQAAAEQRRLLDAGLEVILARAAAAEGASA